MISSLAFHLLAQVTLSASPALASIPPVISTAASPIADESPVHLGISLRLADQAGLGALLARQQDPASPDYHRWLTPEEFGERFGQPAAVYERAASWLGVAGMQVTRFPNRIFLEAQGTAAQANGLLGLRLRAVDARVPAVHVPDQLPTLPASLRALVLHVAGLDTRSRYHHHLAAQGGPAFGPQDLRRFYDIEPLHQAGFIGQGQKLVVLGEAESAGNGPNPVAIEYFLRNVSDATAVFTEYVLPNPQQDFDQAGGGGVEFALDVEMQSVASPGAESITLVMPPASEIFTTGVNYIVNAMSTATAVSLSIGGCEPGIQQQEQGVPESFQQLLQQALAEGQTWSAASGDTGSDDCRDGQTRAVDFPASIPEMVAMGGTQVLSPAWDQNDALTAYQGETAWNGGPGGGAGGGGTSLIFQLPSYQAGLITGGRSVPDLALIAGAPSVLYDDPFPGVLHPVQGTSIASPLSAGFFALIASRVGCRLGDVHPALYALGRAQFDGGAQVFHDITSGSAAYDGVIGPSAGRGFDQATGWGSMDLAALAAAWPPCSPDGGTFDAGAGPAFDPADNLSCGAGTVRTTVPEGPTACVTVCDPADAGSCAPGTVCSSQTPYPGGMCVVGCIRDSDCGSKSVCNTCQEQCVAAGTSSAKIGDACGQDTDCPSGAFCFASPYFLMEGYCSQDCAIGDVGACGCPAGSVCSQSGFSASGISCLESCPTIGEACGQSGFVCQPGSGQGNVCVLPCQVLNFGGGTFDTCGVFSPQFNCDTKSGICSIPFPDGGETDAGMDAGTDGGPGDSGVQPDADAGMDAGPPAPADGGTLGSRTTGCGCSPGAGHPEALFGVIGLLALVRRRRV